MYMMATQMVTGRCPSSRHGGIYFGCPKIENSVLCTAKREGSTHGAHLEGDAHAVLALHFQRHESRLFMAEQGRDVTWNPRETHPEDDMSISTLIAQVM